MDSRRHTFCWFYLSNSTVIGFFNFIMYFILFHHYSLVACFFSKKKDKADLNYMWNKEKLGGVEGLKTMIRIYFVWKNLFSIKIILKMNKIWFNIEDFFFILLYILLLLFYFDNILPFLQCFKILYPSLCIQL